MINSNFKSTENINIPPCFFMLCTNKTEKECLDRGLFGDKRHRLESLKPIKIGNIGFLLNISKDELIGIFVAESEAELNIVPDAWGGEFPAQVKVKLINNKEIRISNASNKLGKFLKLNKITKGNFEYKIPLFNTYGPEITSKVLEIFQIKIDELKLSQYQPDIDILSSKSDYDLDDIAGLEEIKDFIYKRIVAPFENEELAYNLKLKVGGGIFLFGPPGTGKTLTAMAIAKKIEAKFIEISPSIILGYPGEAEKKIEDIFHALRKEPRAVLFLDEAEWILAKREEQTSSVMQRIIPLLLAQLSRIFRERSNPIIVIAATNKPEAIDSAFLRPGRFDKIFYVGLPDVEARKQIIKFQLKDRVNNLTEEDIDEITNKLDGYSGADIEYIINEAAFLAFLRNDEKGISKEDIMEDIKQTSRSVSPEEVERIENWARSRGLKISSKT